MAGDPRSIDPTHAEEDERDVAAQDGSSTPEQDFEEGAETAVTVHGGDEDDRQRALDAMPAGTAEEEDQVGEGE